MCIDVLSACVFMSVLDLLDLDLQTEVRSRHLLLKGEEGEVCSEERGFFSHCGSDPLCADPRPPDKLRFEP